MKSEAQIQNFFFLAQASEHEHEHEFDLTERKCIHHRVDVENVAGEELRFSPKRKTETVAAAMKSEVRKNSDLSSN